MARRRYLPGRRTRGRFGNIAPSGLVALGLLVAGCDATPGSSLEGTSRTSIPGGVAGIEVGTKQTLETASDPVVVPSLGSVATTNDGSPKDPASPGGPSELGPAPVPLTPSELTDAFYVSEPVKRTGLRRLTRAEMIEETRRLFGVAPAFESIALENKPGSHSTFAPQLAVSDVNKARELARAFTEVSAKVPLASVLPCPATDGPDTTCVTGALRSLAENVLRGALPESEWNALHARYRAERLASGHAFAVKAVLQDLLLSPRFAYLLEGGPTPRARAERLLARAAFFLTGRNSPAGSALLSDGTLTKAEYLAHVDALLASAEAGEGLARVLSHWFGMGSLAASMKPVEAANLGNAVASKLEADMWTEFRMLAEAVLLKSEEPLSGLFTAESSFINGTLAGLYGIPLAADAGFRKVSLAGTQRRGVLTTAAVLFSSSKEQGRSPMQRGKFLALNLMCHRFPDGAVAQMILPDRAKSLPTLREKLALLERIQPCSNCHTMLGAGFALERFDPLGREYAEAVVPESDTRTTYQAPGRAPLALVGAAGAAVALAEQEDLPRCLTRRAYEFALGREAGKGDEAHLGAAYGDFKAQGYKVKALLRAIASSPEFLAGTTLE